MLMLLGASYTDLKQKKIKNTWMIFFLLFGILFYQIDFLLHVLIVLILLFPLYFIRVIGAGDLKLVSLVIGYLKVQPSLKVIYIGLVFAGVYSLYRMISKKLVKKRVRYFIEYLKFTIATGKIYKYRDVHTKQAVATIPMAPFLLLGFLSWRAYILWMMRA